MCAGRTFAARAVSSTASAIAFTCRVLMPEHRTKKSVNAGVFRRSRTTTSCAFLSRAARTARDTSVGTFLLRFGAFAALAAVGPFATPLSSAVVRFRSVLAMQVICLGSERGLVVQRVLMNVLLDCRRHDA